MEQKQRLRGTWMLAAMLLAGLAVLPPALAKRGGSNSRLRQQVVLAATPAGQQLALKGKARVEVRADRSREKVQVEVESNLAAAGSQFDAYAVNPANSPNPVFLGTLTLQPNPSNPGEVEGEIELKNYDGQSLPQGLSPVASISGFRVTAPGNPAAVLLQSASPGSGGGSGGGGGGGGGDEVRRRLNLTATAAGLASRTRGYAEIRARDGRDELKFEVESSSLADGTVVEVRFSHSTNGGPFTAGTMALRSVSRGVEGELEFQSHEAPFLPTGAAPVTGITAVTVIHSQTGETLLTGTF